MTDPTNPPPADGPPDPWAPTTRPTEPPGVPAIAPVPGPAAPWNPPGIGAPASPTGPAGAPAGPPLVGPPPSMGPAGGGHQPYLPVAPAPRRPIRTTAIALAAALALVAGAFGLVEATAADGAESPEAAVQALFDAIDQEDALGVVEALEPDERDLLLPVLEELGDQAERLGVAEDLDLRGVSGVDLTVDGLEFETTELAPGVVDVEVVAGTISGSADLAELPLGSTIADRIDDDDESVDPEIDTLAGIHLVARRNDGWHVSALSSLAEEARRSLDPMPAYPSPEDAIPAEGAESPEAAVREAVAAATALDVRRLIELTPPGEMAVLHEYGSILVAEAAREVDEDDGAVAEVTQLELATEDGPDGTKIVKAVSYHLESGDDEDGTTVDYRDGCTTYTYRYTSTDGYGDGDDEGPTTDTDTNQVCEDDPELGYGFAFAAADLEAGSGLRVVAEEHDGRWYLSPTRTILESLLTGVRALDRDDIERMTAFFDGEWWVLEPDSFWEACGVDRPAAGTDRNEAEAAYDDCWAHLPDDYEGTTVGYDTSYDDDYDDYDVEDDPSYACYDQEDRADVEACLEDLVATGEIDPSEVADYRCQVVYDQAMETDDEVTEEQWDALDDAYEACVDAGGEVPSTPTTTTTRPAPSTTVPATTVPPTTTTVPPATTTTRPTAGS